MGQVLSFSSKFNAVYLFDETTHWELLIIYSYLLSLTKQNGYLWRFWFTNCWSGSLRNTGVSEIRVVHHEDLNKKILVALIVASTLLAAILLFISCFWIYRLKVSKTSNTQKAQQSLGISFFSFFFFPLLKGIWIRFSFYNIGVIISYNINPELIICPNN